MLDTIFLQVLDMTKMAGVVILVVIIARLLLKSAPKVFSYALWSVVLFRLLCPVSFETTVSLIPQITPIEQTYSLLDESISFVGASEAAYRAVGDALNGGLGIQHIRTTEVDSAGMVKYVTTDWWEVWILFGQYVWVVGIAIMLLYSMLSYLKLRKKLKVVVPLKDNIFIADDIKSPFVIGFFRPKIYLPCGLTEKEQEYIILHEQHHIRRFDHIMKLLAFWVLCIHWFNPLVWIAFVLASRDMEMSCDEAVVRKIGEDVRADYSASLLTLATGRRIVAGIPLAFGEGDTKGRIKNLANMRMPVLWVSVVAVVGCCILAVCLLTNPQKDETNQSEAIVMIPTTANMQGAFDSYLYLSLKGETYRYERVDLTETVTKDQLIYEFVEMPEFAGHEKPCEWKVYSVEEYPDRSVVLALTGLGQELLYRYSPPKRTDPSVLQQVKEAGCVVMEDSEVTSGQQAWEDFIKLTEEGKSASVQIGNYYTLNPDTCSEQYYEANKEDYPVLYVSILSYDGEAYTLRSGEGIEETVKSYPYLMHYITEVEALDGSYNTYSRYVLTDDNTVTWEELMWQFASSQFVSDYVDFYPVYTDLQ